MGQTTSTDRSTGRGRRLRAAAIAASLGLVLLAACGSDTDSGDGGETTDSTAAADVLGTPNPASGEAVKVGFVSDGRTPSLDNTQMKPAAEATVEYMNEYMGGLGGRPIELIVRETAGDPGKATDCANQMVQEEVALVVMPENQQPGAVHTVVSANDIPLYVYGVADPAITEDANASFMIVSQTAGLAELPIAVAKENDIDNVTVFVVDVPAATAFFDPGHVRGVGVRGRRHHPQRGQGAARRGRPLPADQRGRSRTATPSSTSSGIRPCASPPSTGPRPTASRGPSPSSTAAARTP